ncbi:MAG: hypothetical protein ACREBR_00175 [bacterium]
MPLTEVDTLDADHEEDWHDYASFERMCKVLKGQDASESGIGEPVYLVELENGRTNGEGATYVKNVPHRAMMFVDAPYSSAMHLNDAFRHYIAKPD